MGENMKELYEKYREIIVYLITGVLTTILNWACYGLGVSVFHWPVFVSNLIAWIAAVIFAYVTNKLIVFRSHCSSIGELAAECARFIGARLATMVIEVGGVYVLYNIIHQDELIAKLETQVLVVIGNYFISRFLVFRDRK
jgi:putative flippase GtrA